MSFAELSGACAGLTNIIERIFRFEFFYAANHVTGGDRAVSISAAGANNYNTRMANDRMWLINDVVVLVRPFKSLPAGTEATILQVFADAYQVEFEGVMHDTVGVTDAPETLPACYFTRRNPT